MAIAFVQSKTATGNSVTTLSTAAFTNPTTIGNLLVVAISLVSSAVVTLTLSDSQSNTWTVAINQAGINGATSFRPRAAIWTAPILSASSSHTVTASTSGTASIRLSATEFSGLSGVKDQTNGAASTGGTSVTPTTSATTNANDLLIGCFASDGSLASVGVNDPPAGYTSLFVSQNDTNPNVAHESCYQIVSSTGVQSVAYTFTSDANGLSEAVIAAIMSGQFIPTATTAWWTA